jgi:ATP-dependent DNA helicase RecG
VSNAFSVRNANPVSRGECGRVADLAQRTEAAKAVSAMLNGLGGFVLFGATDRGNIIGQPISPRTLEEVANDMRRIDPPAFPDIEMVNLASGNDVIALRVPGGGGPYVYDGRSYLRNGPTTILKKAGVKSEVGRSAQW